jgi:hypothetical protein
MPQTTKSISTSSRLRCVQNDVDGMKRYRHASRSTFELTRFGDSGRIHHQERYNLRFFFLSNIKVTFVHTEIIKSLNQKGLFECKIAASETGGDGLANALTSIGTEANSTSSKVLPSRVYHSHSTFQPPMLYKIPSVKRKQQMLQVHDA